MQGPIGKFPVRSHPFLLKHGSWTCAGGGAPRLAGCWEQRSPERALMEILGGDLLPRAGLCRKGRKGGLGAGNLLESCRVLLRVSGSWGEDAVLTGYT